MQISANSIRAIGILLGLISLNLQAEVQVDNAWMRLLPPTSKMTAAYMTLTSDQDDRLLRVSSEAASAIEIHVSKMEEGVMTMREMSCLALPAKQPVELKPQSYHLMVMGLKAPLAAGQVHTFVLHFEQAGSLEVAVPVKN